MIASNKKKRILAKDARKAWQLSPFLLSLWRGWRYKRLVKVCRESLAALANYARRGQLRTLDGTCAPGDRFKYRDCLSQALLRDIFLGDLCANLILVNECLGSPKESAKGHAMMPVVSDVNGDSGRQQLNEKSIEKPVLPLSD